MKTEIKQESRKTIDRKNKTGERKTGYLCLDVGGTSIKYAVSDEEGQFLCSGKIPIEKSAQGFLNQTEELYRRLAPIDGIACAFPGEVHSEEGVIRGISAVEYLHNIPIKKAISDRCGGCQVTMLNDANAAALGEWWRGVGKAYKNIAFVIVGSGVGGAVIENGILYPGTTKNKAEIGNFLMGGVKDGVRMSWSCFTLEKEARKYSADFGVKVNGKELLQMARRGNAEAGAYVEEFFYYMAVGCLYVQFAYDPEIIAIGGGISEDVRMADEIMAHYRKLVEGQRMAYRYPKIVRCENGSRANLLGALYYFLNKDS